MTDFKVGIVGAQENKWPKLAIPIVKDSIRLALTKEYYVCKECGYNFKWPHVVNHVEQGLVETFKPTIMVSGGCTYKGVDTWAEKIADELGITKLIFKPEVEQWLDGHQERAIKDSYIFQKGCSKCEASYPYDAARWLIGLKDAKPCSIGYKSRNIQIAKSVDILYVISPQSKDAYCKHCKVTGHIGNGGCWTGNTAEKLGKKVIRIVI